MKYGVVYECVFVGYRYGWPFKSSIYIPNIFLKKVIVLNMYQKIDNIKFIPCQVNIYNF